MFAEVEPLQSIYTASGTESGLLFEAIQDILNQMYVETATWGLESWESMLGIPMNQNESDSGRREVIISRLRGIGGTTKGMIVNMAAAFSGGEVEVIEVLEENKFIIKFVGILGIPENLKGLSAAVEQVKPAHLDYGYEYTYNTYEKINQKRHSELSLFTYENLRSSELL